MKNGNAPPQPFQGALKSREGLDRQKRSLSKTTFVAGRWILGLLFLYAGFEKAFHPQDFAQIILNYRILPDPLINPTAVLLPWLEIVLGLLLILGRLLPGAVLLGNFLLVVFFAAILFNLARGLDIDCGCFSTAGGNRSGGAMSWYVIRDGILLLLAGFLSFQTFFPKKSAPVREDPQIR